MFMKPFLILLKLLCVSLIIGSLTGCASVTRGTKDKLKVISEPSGADVRLSTGATGVTPATFKLPRKKGVTVEISKEGYLPQTVLVNSKFASGGGVALAGNVLIGGIIGAGVDGLTGATLSLKPNPVQVTLLPVPPPDAPMPESAPATAPPPPPEPATSPPAAGDPPAVATE
jgi:hypothetical protein